MKRRLFLVHTMAYGLGAPALCPVLAPTFADGLTKSASSPSSMALLGQVVIRQAVDLSAWPGHEALQHRLASADGVFANLESIINMPRAGTLTRPQLTLNAADLSALATLDFLGISLLGTANNHAFDLHSDGVLNTIEALSAAAIPFAGTGKDKAKAAAPAYATTGKTITAVVAFATGMLRPGAIAGEETIGVNPLRRDATGRADFDDVQRILSAIREATSRADVVIACHHNHDRGPGSDSIPYWQRAFAHQCIDEGATVFVSHGVPVLQGIEIYRGAPLFFGLGNFMFQVAKPVGAYEDGTWEGVVALCAFESGRCQRVRLMPIVLNETAADGSVDGARRGLPSLASPTQAQHILAYLQTRSVALGTHIITMNGEGTIFPT